MTLTEALDRLHRAGRIASPWLPGMLVHAADGRYGTPQRLGQQFSVPSDGRPWCPVTTDHATQGALISLVREADGQPVAVTLDVGMGVARLTLDGGGGIGSRCTTHTAAGDVGAVCAAALVALAKTVPA